MCADHAFSLQALRDDIAEMLEAGNPEEGWHLCKGMLPMWLQAIDEHQAHADNLALRIRLVLPLIRAKTGNPLFDAGTHDACDRIEALL
jgi:hypothetical protein